MTNPSTISAFTFELNPFQKMPALLIPHSPHFCRFNTQFLKNADSPLLLSLQELTAFHYLQFSSPIEQIQYYDP
jgi:hypothetical protein